MTKKKPKATNCEMCGNYVLKEKLETMKVKAAGNNIENSVQRDKGKEEYL